MFESGWWKHLKYRMKKRKVGNHVAQFSNEFWNSIIVKLEGKSIAHPVWPYFESRGVGRSLARAKLFTPFPSWNKDDSRDQKACHVIRYANRRLDQSAFRGNPDIKYTRRAALMFPVTWPATRYQFVTLSALSRVHALLFSRWSFKDTASDSPFHPPPPFPGYFSRQDRRKCRSSVLTIAPNRQTDEFFLDSGSIAKWVSPCSLPLSPGLIDAFNFLRQTKVDSPLVWY